MSFPSYTFSCRGRSCARSRILARVDCAVSEHPDPNSASGLSALSDTQFAREPCSYVPSRGSFADSGQPSNFDRKLSPQCVRRNPVPRDSSAPDHSEHHVIAPRPLRAVSPFLPTSTSQVHPSHAPSSLHMPQPRTLLYDTNRVPGLEPQRTFLPPFATVVSYETYRLHDKRTILAPNENLELHRIKRKLERLIPTLKPFNCANPIKLLRFSRSYEMVSVPSESPKPPQSVAYTSSSRERPRRFTNHSLPEELFPQHVVVSSRGPR